jgi:hypothetical protein
MSDELPSQLEIEMLQRLADDTTAPGPYRALARTAAVRLAEAEAILRTLTVVADGERPEDDPIIDDVYGHCALCGRDAERRPLEAHLDNCPWRRAIEYQRAHG